MSTMSQQPPYPPTYQYPQQQQYPQQYQPQPYQDVLSHQQHPQQYPPYNHPQQPQPTTLAPPQPQGPYLNPNAPQTTSSATLYSEKSALSTASAASSTSPPLSNAISLSPTHALYITKHSIYAKSTPITNLTHHPSNPLSSYAGDTIPSSFLAAAKDVGPAAPPLFTMRKKHWYSSRSSFVAVREKGEEEEVANLKNISSSCSKAEMKFVKGRAAQQGVVSMKPVKWLTRRNAFVFESRTFTWGFESRVKSSRMVLVMEGGAGGEVIIVARYADKHGTGNGNGVLLIDAREIDLAVATLTAMVMLRRTQLSFQEANSGGGNSGASAAVAAAVS
ncbi:unnamed protein product [Periconia digitata]|uniref:Uncharacterized protein n=1 Tax=Periconia digitata TaxID=1303443 RepID=A0A9W4XPJ4_9PLEO|nr:unnamed protein product [Periconia digitata]